MVFLSRYIQFVNYQLPVPTCFKTPEGKGFNGMQQFLNSLQNTVWLKYMLNSKYYLPAYYIKAGSLRKTHISAFQKAQNWSSWLDSSRIIQVYLTPWIRPISYVFGICHQN